MQAFKVPHRTMAAAAMLLATGLLSAGCAESFSAGSPSPAPPETRPEASSADSAPSSALPSAPSSGQASRAPLQVITIPLGEQSGVEARLPINGYSGPPGAEITYDASQSVGVVVKYEWDFDGDGTYDRTTTDPVLKHRYKAECARMVI